MSSASRLSNTPLTHICDNGTDSPSQGGNIFANKKAGLVTRLSCLWRLCHGVQAAAVHMHSPCLVILRQEVENLLRRKFLVPVKREGLVDADGERVSYIDFGTCGADRDSRFLLVIRHRDALAVVGASDEQIALHVSSMRELGAQGLLSWQ